MLFVEEQRILSLKDVNILSVYSFSISAQSNFAVGAVVNATFGSITELTFYITALLRGHRTNNPCLQEVVKAALTGTLLGCILFIPVSQPGSNPVNPRLHKLYKIK